MIKHLFSALIEPAVINRFLCVCVLKNIPLKYALEMSKHVVPAWFNIDQLPWQLESLMGVQFECFRPLISPVYLIFQMDNCSRICYNLTALGFKQNRSVDFSLNFIQAKTLTYSTNPEQETVIFNLHEGGCPEGCRLILSWHRIFQLSVRSQMCQFRLTQSKMKTGQTPKFTLSVSRQLISTKFPIITFYKSTFLKCCFFRFSVPWYLDSWQKKAAIT